MLRNAKALLTNSRLLITARWL